MNVRLLMKLTALLLLALFSSGCKQSIANKEVNKKVNEFQFKALGCLDVEQVNRNQVLEFFMHRPNTPYYKHLIAARDNIRTIMDNSDNFSNNDKVKHCFVGYRLAQRWDRPTGVFSAFYKEAQDVGDCNRRTRFEVEDQVATIIGTNFFQNDKPISDCHNVNDILARRTQKFLAKRDEANQKRKEILERLQLLANQNSSDNR